MMKRTEGNGELIAHLERQTPRLREGHMMSMRRALFANEARFGGDTGKMGLVTDSAWTCQGQHGLVDRSATPDAGCFCLLAAQRFFCSSGIS
jgi:hypothetical protein